MSYHLKIKFSQQAVVNPLTGDVYDSGYCAEVKLPTLGQSIMIPTRNLTLPRLAVAKKGSSPIHVFTALGMMCVENQAYEELEALIEVMNKQTQFTYKIMCDPKNGYEIHEMNEEQCREALWYLKGYQPQA